MKITFLCGSLEPGRDGVGDYTRRLAGELVRSGHQISIVSIFDSFIKDELIGKQCVDEVELTVLRLPSIIPFNKRLKSAKCHIDSFDPNWLSLQFVPYAFHAKGLPFYLSSFFKSVGQGRKWHIMFHELWIGSSHSLKSLFYASLQKLIIKDLNRQLNPTIVHTHLPIYYSKLKRLRFNVMVLPLFSNIPVHPVRKIKDNGKIFRIGIFSQVDINQNIFCFIQEINQVLFNRKIFLELLLIGDNNKLKVFGTMLEVLLDGQVLIKYTGFLQSEEVSCAIQSCDIGLTSVPRHALGKSGSVAAFISHGIPVAAPNIYYSEKPEVAPFFSDTFCSAIIKNADYKKICEAKETVNVVKGEIDILNIARKFMLDIIDSSF
ncbi:glycosyltransferase [Flavisolibacter tropicus]|uniref:Glycosyl transferase family 1 domain-containing protein n=1 Tax=Flavisolibacter tropicus TaxID=1492898 RepID=A0A172TQG9_9BACT|nr:glycosyltransferase [Flavisolibacter tropicus]ANE49258.1 hypothetical protein SY85_00805 [Flavisolibacter tropicus]